MVSYDIMVMLSNGKLNKQVTYPFVSTLPCK